MQQCFFLRVARFAANKRLATLDTLSVFACAAESTAVGAHFWTWEDGMGRGVVGWCWVVDVGRVSVFVSGRWCFSWWFGCGGWEMAW